MRFSASLMTMERRSVPIMILSLARSNSSMPTMRLLARAANSAASFTRLARSAPEKPGVPRAISAGLTSSASGTRRMCTRRICSRPQQRRVEHVRTVGGGDDDDALVALEAIHLDEQLIEGLLALIVAAAQAGAAMAANRVDLIDEDDAWSVLLRLLEHVAHARSTDADEHLDEVGPRDGEEGNLGFPGDGAREQRLAGARG